MRSRMVQRVLFSAVIAADLAAVQAILAAEPEAAYQRVNQRLFPPSPQHHVHNILTFIVGRESTTLQAAAIANQPKMIELLIDVGVDPNVRGGYDNSTALHTAAWENAVSAAQRLIARGADINRLSGEIHRNSPAGWAIVAGSADVFELLMDAGADRLGCFADDVEAAVAGEFRRYKPVPQVNYDRIRQRWLAG